MSLIFFRLAVPIDTVYAKRNAHLIPIFFLAPLGEGEHDMTLDQGQKPMGPWKQGCKGQN